MVAVARRALFVGGAPCSSVGEVLDTYHPRVPGLEAFEDTINAWISVSGVVSAASAWSAKRYLCLYTAWRLSHGGKLTDPETFLDVDAVNYWLSLTYPDAPSSFANARSALYKIGRAVTSGVQYPPAPNPKPRRRVRPPYAPGDIDKMLTQATRQPNRQAAHILTALVLFPLATGVRTGEYTHLTPNDVHTATVAGHQVTYISVTHGNYPRLVPARADYADRLMTLAQQAREWGWEFVCGPVDHGASDPVWALRRQYLWPARGLPHPNMPRLRTTWMARLLAGPVIVDEFMEIAGLDTMRSIEDLIDHVRSETFPPQHAAVYTGTLTWDAAAPHTPARPGCVGE